MIPRSVISQPHVNARNLSSAPKMTPPGSVIIDGAAVRLPDIAPSDPFLQVVKTLAVYKFLWQISFHREVSNVLQVFH